MPCFSHRTMVCSFLGVRLGPTWISHFFLSQVRAMFHNVDTASAWGPEWERSWNRVLSPSAMAWVRNKLLWLQPTENFRIICYLNITQHIQSATKDQKIVISSWKHIADCEMREWYGAHAGCRQQGRVIRSMSHSCHRLRSRREKNGPGTVRGTASGRWNCGGVASSCRSRSSLMVVYSPIL